MSRRRTIVNPHDYGTELYYMYELRTAENDRASARREIRNSRAAAQRSEENAAMLLMGSHRIIESAETCLSLAMLHYRNAQRAGHYADQASEQVRMYRARLSEQRIDSLVYWRSHPEHAAEMAPLTDPVARLMALLGKRELATAERRLSELAGQVSA
jgi:hypothetical protein